MPSKAMNVLRMEEADGQDGKPVKTFLNGMHVKDLADVEPAGEVSVTATSADLSSYWGKQIAFKDIVKAGALVKKSDGNYGQAGGFTMGWDNCSDTPYLFNKDKTTVVTYDGAPLSPFNPSSCLLTFALLDTWSLGDKAKFAKSSGMAGCCTWSLDQVSFTWLLPFVHPLMLIFGQDDNFTLQDAVRAGLGLPK